MLTDRRCWLALAATAMLAGCEHGPMELNNPGSPWGEANRQTFAAQVIDPDPRYDTLDPPTDAEHAAQAVERYRQDKVKKPERVTSTQTSSGGGSGGGK